MREPWPVDHSPALDRSAHRRATVDSQRADAVLTAGGAVLLEGSRLALVPADERSGVGSSVYLGVVGGRNVVADLLPEQAESGEGRAWAPLRVALGVFAGPSEALDRELASTAVAMATWHARAAYCPICGSRTESREAGWVLRCPTDGVDHFPRTDPAIIVAITDPDDRLLLSHVSYHSPLRYTHLAGYVEPGESLEQAVHREVREESRLALASLDYVGSQPWPFPASVMVAFRATVLETEVEVDGVEVTDAAWFTREEVAARVAERTIQLAPPGSIARRLVHDWYGGEIVEPDDVA